MWAFSRTWPTEFLLKCGCYYIVNWVACSTFQYNSENLIKNFTLLNLWNFIILVHFLAFFSKTTFFSKNGSVVIELPLARNFIQNFKKIIGEVFAGIRDTRTDKQTHKPESIDPFGFQLGFKKLKKRLKHAFLDTF